MLKTQLNKLTTLCKDKNAWLALIAGCALTLAYAPFGLWPLTFVCLIIAIYVTDQPTPKQAAKYGFLFGFGWFALGISWVHVSIAQFGGLPIALSLLAMAFLCAYLAIYPALAFAFANRYSKSHWQRLALLISGFAITEYLRGTLLTGFPWLSFGYTLTDSPLNSLAPWIGEFGLTLICVALGYAGYWLLRYRHYKSVMVTLTPIALLYLFSAYSTDNRYSGQQLKTLLVQGNIEQSLRWAPEQFWPTMSKYQDMTRPNWADVDLVVWPEAAIPEIEDYAFDYLINLDKAAAFNNTALITGIPDYQFDTRNVYNTLIVLGKKQRDDQEGHYRYLHRNRYQKHQLLPIGEFVPFEDVLRPLAPLFDLPMSSFSRGDAVQNNLLANGLHVLPAICYEIAFSELVRGNYTHESDILFTVSNDAWFGDSHGPHQHMQIARMRALELQRPMVRVTNNGISGVYDPLSQQQVTIPQFTSEVLSTELKLISGHSFFSKQGHTPVWLFVGLLLLLVFFTNAKSYLSSKMEKAFF
ncbi:apolipoprotein N-acyltransferase [Pseudoalteromonas luteoviolacea]|uniref:apolipoprotein N-acyltransferase n=1 Tax=Pseudoalteromonas luteoviolacea TaxID=43657 RepID=UPI001B379D57|nr:apolipoprotein N-acyltransferase [Pseudoalteromonas luteoviolacea]MBQ4814524.1 apolipoprotein N-acyltransferase [Pseudoalteromonas luteoviolacea]